MRRMRDVPRIAALFASLVLLSSLPARAHDADRDDRPLILNGHLNTADFTGGVGVSAYQSDDCCYGGTYIVMGQQRAFGRMGAGFAFARAGAFARASAFAHAHAGASLGGHR